MLSLWTTLCKTCGRHTHEDAGLVMRNVFDMLGTITLSTRAALAGSSRRTIYGGVLCLSVINMSPAEASKDIDLYKLYAHSRIVNEIQYICFRDLIQLESRWNLNSINPNGKHFGLGQMKNNNYRNLDAYRMIDWSIRYYVTRYGSHCNAYRFFKKNGYS